MNTHPLVIFGAAMGWLSGASEAFSWESQMVAVNFVGGMFGIAHVIVGLYVFYLGFKAIHEE